MSINRSSRLLAATFVVASLTASPAMASGGPMDLRSPDAQDAARQTAPAADDRRSPDARDAAGQTGGTAADLRVTSSLAGPPPGNPVPGLPEFPTNTIPLPRPAAPVAASPSGDGFDWDSAGIGAGGAAVVGISLAGGLMFMSRRRRVATA
jgi:hypothetical protein